MKIARKISLSFLLTALILTNVAVFIIYIGVKSNLNKSIFQHLMTAAESRANHIETFLREHKHLVQLLSTEILFMEILNINKNNSEYHKKFESVNDRLNAVIKIHEDIIKVSILDKNGVVLASSDKASVGSDKSDDETFLNAKKAIYIKDVHLSKTSGMPAVAFAAPVLWNGESVGVIIADFSAKALFNIALDKTGLGETGEIYLVNKDYYMISPSRFNKNVILKQKVDTVNAKYCMEHRDNEHMAMSKMVGVFKDYRGKKAIGTHIYIPEMKWALLAEIDEKEAFKPMEMITLILVAILISVPIVAWLIGIFVSAMISGPIHTLHKGTEIIANGNLDHKIDVDTKDEIGQLSRAFNKMTGNLKKTTISIDELNTEVAHRKQVEETLRESQQVIEGIINTIPARIFWKDKNLVYLGCNALFAQDAGLADPKDIIGKDDYQMVWRDQAELYRGDDREVIESGDAKLLIEEPQTTPEGNTITLLTSKIPLRSSTGEISGALGMYMDITERKKAEEKLRESEERFRALFNNAAEGILVAELKSKQFRFANPAICKMLGYSEDELIGMNVMDIHPEKSLDHIISEFEAQARGEKALAPNMPCRRKDGQIIYTDINTGKANIQGVEYNIGLFTDITERKQIEAELEQHRNHLESLVEIRTAELVAANKKAEDSNRAKTEFLSNVSHELRSPLNIIMGMNYLLQQTDLTSKQKKYLNDYQQAIIDLHGLISNILDFNTLEQDEMIVEETEFDLNDLLAMIIDQAKSKAHRKGLAFRIKTGPDIPAMLVGDAQQLSRVLHHLIDNAIKVTEQGGITLGVSRQDPAIGEQSTRIILRFEVVDTGIGISREQSGKLFQDFIQLDGSSTRKYGGVGLGLSVCKRLVELMGGEIGFESNSGRGSTFFFTLKLGCVPDISQQIVVQSSETRPEVLKTGMVPGGRHGREELKKIVPQMKEFAGLLSVNDTRSQTVFAEVKDQLRALRPTEADAIGKKLDNFDFKGALDMLKTIAEYADILLE